MKLIHLPFINNPEKQGITIGFIIYAAVMFVAGLIFCIGGTVALNVFMAMNIFLNLIAVTLYASQPITDYRINNMMFKAGVTYALLLAITLFVVKYTQKLTLLL